MPGPRLLIYLDKLLQLPYRLMVNLFMLMRSGKSISEKKQVVIIKMMGIGSITRIYRSLTAENVDFNQTRFVTLTSNKDLLDVLGITHTYFIRDNNLLILGWDLLKLSWTLRIKPPGYLINYERGSNMLGLFQIWSTSFTRIRTVSFHDFKRDITTNFDAIYSIHNRSFQQLISKTFPCYYLSGNEEKPPMELVINTKKVLININASDYMPYRKYPVDHFVTLIKELHTWDTSLSFDLIGSAGEMKYVDSLLNQVASLETVITNRCGQWSLSDLMINLTDCVLLITNDSGPMHLGALVNTPMIAIWGPTSQEFFGYESPYITNIQTDISCAPCFLYAKSKAAKKCNKRIDCMKGISSEEILKASKQKLTNPDLFRMIELPHIKNLADQSIYALTT